MRHKLEAKNWSLEYEGQGEFRKLTLKSPNNTKLDISDTSTCKQIELSKVSKIETGVFRGR